MTEKTSGQEEHGKGEEATIGEKTVIGGVGEPQKEGGEN